MVQEIYSIAFRSRRELINNILVHIGIYQLGNSLHLSAY